MDRCNELCTKDATGTCTVCDALAERDRFWQLWFRGGLFVAGIHALQRWRAFGFLRQHLLLVFGAVGLLLTLLLPASSPEWNHHVLTFLRARPPFLGMVGLGLLYVLLWKLPKWQVAGVEPEKDRVTAESAFRQTLAQMVGGAVLLLGLYFTAQTLRTTQEGQITDRFTKAIGQLGDNNNLAVRLGGIYALERIAKDSEKDHWAVMEVLTAFVREHAPLKEQPQEESLGAGEVKANQPRPAPRTEIQAVLTVLGRRTRTPGKGERRRLDLRRTNLQDVYLYEANLQGAALGGANLQGAALGVANLQGAYLREAQLQRAVLGMAQLQDAYLGEAQLQDAVLIEANLQDAYLGEAQLQDAWLQGANLQGADLGGANLQEVRFLTQEQVNQACGDEQTKLPEGFAPPPPCPK